MTVGPLVERPGIMKEVSAYAAKAYWTDGSNVRWRKGFPERIGGSERYINSVLDTPCRGVHEWRALDGTALMAFGTQNKLWIMAAGILYDITPAGLPAGDGSGLSSVGGWGDLGYGSPYWGGGAPVLLQDAGARTWSLDNWGEDLIANYFGGPIYHWVFSTSFKGGSILSLYGMGNARTSSGKAVLIAGAPATARGIFVSDEDRHLVAIGAHDGVSDNPRNVAWCDQEDLSVWTASDTNSAGSRTVSGGDILGAVKTRLGHLIISSTSAFLMRFTAGEFVFAIDCMGDNCGGIGPKAMVDHAGTAYWMGIGQFWKFDGAVKQLDCDVRSYVFDNLNTAETAKCHAGLVRENSEVWFFYVSEGDEIDRYVAVNAIDNTWFIGPKIRTCWIDSGVIVNSPVAVDADGHILLQETGDTEDGVALDYFLETNEIEQINGEQITVFRRLIPDYQQISGDHLVYIKVRPYPQRAQRTKGPYTVNSSTGVLPVRARGRSGVVRFSGSSLFRMGQWRGDVTTHGTRT